MLKRVDFNGENLTIGELQQQLRFLMNERVYITACEYCDCLGNHVAGVKLAVKPKEENLFYEKFKD